MAAIKIDRKGYGKGTFITGVLVIAFLIVFFGMLHSAVAARFDYSDFAEFLDRYVVEQKKIKDFTLNVVDYGGIQKSLEKPGSLYESLLKQFEEFDPGTIQNRENEIAFWINAYNIGAIKMIMDHYPVDSIRSRKINWLKNPWNKRILTIGKATYSLGQIEHEILIGKYGEPLIHFGIVCASLSCPELSKQVYEGSHLVAQLEKQARLFLKDTKRGLRIDRKRGEVYFSQVFKFDKKTFPNGARDALPLIVRFVESAGDREYLLEKEYKVKYLDYDWSLNTLQSAE
jgi:hypothetical protein